MYTVEPVHARYRTRIGTGTEPMALVCRAKASGQNNIATFDFDPSHPAALRRLRIQGDSQCVDSAAPSRRVTRSKVLSKRARRLLRTPGPRVT